MRHFVVCLISAGDVGERAAGFLDSPSARDLGVLVLLARLILAVCA